MLNGQPDTQIMQLLERVGRRAYGYAWQLLRNDDDALDAVQSALVAAWRQRRRLNPQRNVRGWFYRVLRNHCIDQLRARRVHQPDVLESDPASRVAVDPAEAANKNEQVARLRQELARLPDDMREILLLRDYHDLSYAELAQVLNIPAGTVMSRLHRARSTLRERMLANG